MVAEPGFDQGPVMRVDSQPSLPKQDASLSQDAASLRGDENSRLSFPTPWLDAVNKSKACSSSSGTTHGRTMPPTSIKGKAQSRPCKARDGATRHQIRRASGRGKPTPRTRAWKLQHSASGDKALGISNEVDGSCKSEGPHFISGAAKFTEHHYADVDKSQVHSAAGAVQKAIRRISAGLKDLSAGVGTLLEAGGDLSEQLNLVQRRLAKIEQQLLQPEVRLNAESQEFQPQAAPEAKLEVTPEAQTEAALQISRDEDYKVCASAVDGGVRSDITAASEHGGATITPLTAPVSVRVSEVKPIPEVLAEMRQRLAQVEEQQKKHKAEVQQEKGQDGRQTLSDKKLAIEVKPVEVHQKQVLARELGVPKHHADPIAEDEGEDVFHLCPEFVSIDEDIMTENKPSTLSTSVDAARETQSPRSKDRRVAADYAAAPQISRNEDHKVCASAVDEGTQSDVAAAFEHGGATVADHGGATVAPITAPVPVDVKGVISDVAAVSGTEHGEAQPTPLTPVATVPRWWRAFAQDRCDVADYGGATVVPSTAPVAVGGVKPAKPAYENKTVETKPDAAAEVKLVVGIKPVVEVVKPVAEVKPVVEVVKPVAEVKPVAVGERLLKKQGWKEGEGLGAKAQGLRTPPDFGQTRTPCDRAGLGSETRHGTRRGKTVISRNSDINFVRELPGRKEYSLKVCQHIKSRHPCGKDYLRGTYRIPVARELGDTLTQSLAEVKTFSLAQRGRDVEALLHSVQTTMEPQVATTLIGEVMFSLTHHSAYADTSNGPNDMPSGIAELIYPSSGTVQITMEGEIPFIRGAGNCYYLPLFKCTRDVETGQFPDWYLKYLPRFYVNECNGEISIDPSRYGGVDKYQVRLNTAKRDNFDYDLRTDSGFASAVIHTLLQRCDWHVLARIINKFRHAALYYQLEFALDCVKRDVPIPDDWLDY